MKNKLFIDSWGWIAIQNKQEPRYLEINAFYKNFSLQGGVVYTSDYVLDETITLLFRRLPYSLAQKAIILIDEAVNGGYLRLEWITHDRFEKAKKLRLKLQDKPRISFTDLTSMVIMNEIGVMQVLTDDEHFMQVGMNFHKVP